MAPYIAIAIWLVSHVICLQICKARRIKPVFPVLLLVAVLGPLAIPLASMLPRKPEGLKVL